MNPALYDGKKYPVSTAFNIALQRYCADHPNATAEAYQLGRVVTRVRIIDPAFDALPSSERYDAAWYGYFADLPEEDRESVTQVLLLTPNEANDSPRSRDFDEPSPLLNASAAAESSVADAG